MSATLAACLLVPGTLAVMAAAALGQAGSLSVPVPEKGTKLPAAASTLPATSRTAPATNAKNDQALTPRTKFQSGESIDELLQAMALKFDVIVIEPKPVPAILPKAVDLPERLEDALSLARGILEPQGYAMVQSVTHKPVAKIMLRILTTQEARQAALLESPVTSGIDPTVIDMREPGKLVTHMVPVAHPAIIDALKRTATHDAEVTADIVGTARTGITMIVSGPASKVKSAVSAVIAVDKPEEVHTVVRQLKLRMLNAEMTAAGLNAEFAAEPGNGPPMRAVADRRTNTLIVNGPEEKVVDTMVRVLQMDLAGTGRTAAPDSGERSGIDGGAAEARPAGKNP